MIPNEKCKHNKVSLCTVVRSFLANCENQWKKLGLSILFFLVFWFIKQFLPLRTCGFDISNIFVTIFSNLLGFAIAGYAIILSFGKEIVCILLKPFEEDVKEGKGEKEQKNPFQILSATFTYCCIILLITNIILLFFNHCCWYLLIVYFFCSYSLVLVGDLIMHLYSTSYYLRAVNKEECKEKVEGTNNGQK